MVLETGRLTLREIVDDDAPFILELLNDPSFIENIGDRGVRSLDDARAYIRNGPVTSYGHHGFGLWLVEVKQGGAYSLTLHAEPYDPTPLFEALERRQVPARDFIRRNFLPSETGPSVA